MVVQTGKSTDFIPVSLKAAAGILFKFSNPITFSSFVHPKKALIPISLQADKSTSAINEQPLNASLPIDVQTGNFTVLSAVEQKAQSGILINISNPIILSSFMHPLKAEVPNFLQADKSTSVIDEQPPKASEPTEVHFDKSIFSRLEQPLKALSGIEVSFGLPTD